MDAIYIPTCRKDLRLTRICVASIRYFHPDIPIRLLVDRHGGPCDVSEICSAWQVEELPTPPGGFGGGYAKLEVLFDPQSGRFLVLDSDIVFAGPLLELFAGVAEDFIVVDEEYDEATRCTLFLRDEEVMKVAPQSTPVRFLFNAGQFVGRGGLVRREDVEPWLEFSTPRRKKHPQALLGNDQGILNYVINQHANAGRITVRRTNFMRWSQRDLSDVDLGEIKRGPASRYRFLIHWAGEPRRHLRDLPRSDILRFFEDHYYTRVPRHRLTLRLGADFFHRVIRRLKNPFGRRHRPKKRR